MPPTSPGRPRRAHHLLLLIAVIIGAIALPAGPVRAERLTANGWTTSSRTNPTVVASGGPVTIVVDVVAEVDRQALVDVEVYDPQGHKVAQQFWDAQRFVAGQRARYRLYWTAGATAGLHMVKVGIFSTGWGTLHHWHDRATTFSVTATSPPPGRFETLPVGAALPSDADCAARVRGAPEIRPANTSYNQTRGQTSPASAGLYARVTGNFTGTTDEIIQWASCKWGFDEDVVRAQTAKESWWFQRNGGDFTTDPARCAPGHGFGVDGRSGECAESVGVQQVRYPYHQQAFPWATTSTAHNLDYALAVRRNCFEGNETWFNQVERGREYTAGDLWGCIGAWFSGRWYTAPSVEYITAVQDYLAQRIWTRPEFVNSTG